MKAEMAQPGWSLDQLSDFCRRLGRQDGDSAWRQGFALNLARGKCRFRGEWLEWVAKTYGKSAYSTVNRYRNLAKKVTRDAIQNLSLDDAYIKAGLKKPKLTEVQKHLAQKNAEEAAANAKSGKKGKEAKQEVQQRQADQEQTQQGRTPVQGETNDYQRDLPGGLATVPTGFAALSKALPDYFPKLCTTIGKLSHEIKKVKPGKRREFYSVSFQLQVTLMLKDLQWLENDMKDLIKMMGE